MTEKEAIANLKSIQKEYEKKKFGVEALKMSIKALEKQIAKKIDVWANGEEHCPCCDKNLTTFFGFANCFSCGQKLDWGNKDAE